MDSKVFIPLSPCKELLQLPWTFWRNNSIILTSPLKSVLAFLNINLNSRVYFLDLDEKLFEVFKYNLENEYYIQQEIGFINSPNFLNYVTYIWDRRTNLSRVHLKINYFNMIPFIMYQNNSKEIKGYHGEIFNTLQEKLQFSYDIQEEKIFGGPDNNSIYNGMLGKIQAGYNNWSIADCVQTEERSLTFDFSIPILDLPKRIITRRPNEQFETFAYFSVFSQEFWICIFTSAVLLTIFMYWILRFYIIV